MVDRALEFAMAEPRGPVYLTLPREVLAQPLGDLTISSPARRQVESRRFPDPARIEEAADRLVAARSPLIVTAELGRARAAVDGLVALADAGGFPVLESSPVYVNFPADHPCHAGWVFGSQDYPGMAEADVVLVIDCDVPWFPSRSRPADDATVIQLAVDPFSSRYPMRSYPCDVPLAAEPAVALPLLAEAVRRRVDPALVAARRARLGEAHRARRESWARAALEERVRAIGFQWASRCVGEALGADTIVVNEYPLDLVTPRRRDPEPASARPIPEGSAGPSEPPSARSSGRRRRPSSPRSGTGPTSSGPRRPPTWRRSSTRCRS